MATISLPTVNRRFAPYTTGEPIVLPKGPPPKLNRVAYAAAQMNDRAASQAKRAFLIAYDRLLQQLGARPVPLTWAF